jgi:hypothetical protein
VVCQYGDDSFTSFAKDISYPPIGLLTLKKLLFTARAIKDCVLFVNIVIEHG